MNEQKQVNTKSVIKITVIVMITIIVVICLFFILLFGGIFATCGGAYLIGSKVIEKVDEERVALTKEQIRQLESALKLFKVDAGFYPETQQGLDALVTPPAVGQIPRLYSVDGYLEGGTVPLDQWGNEYLYRGPDQTGDGTYEIISAGSDLTYGTKDDISSRDAQGGL